MGLDISKRQAALTDLVNRLRYIAVAKGYNTDAGARIYLGEMPRFGQGDPPAALAVAIGDSVPEQAGPTVRSRVPFEVWAIVPAGTADPLAAVEAIIADILEAVEIEDNPTRTRALGTMLDGVPHGTTPKGLERGVIRALRREEGSEYVGAAVEYIATFETPWGTQ
jgi:hypothetical protein